MIFAEIHGKLARDYSRAHERAEDLLTSTVFGLLRYLPHAEGFVPILQHVRQVRPAGQAVKRPNASWIDPGRVEQVQVEFWPRWPGYGEPGEWFHRKKKGARVRD